MHSILAPKVAVPSDKFTAYPSVCSSSRQVLWGRVESIPLCQFFSPAILESESFWAGLTDREPKLSNMSYLVATLGTNDLSLVIVRWEGANCNRKPQASSCVGNRFRPLRHLHQPYAFCSLFSPLIRYKSLPPPLQPHTKKYLVYNLTW